MTDAPHGLLDARGYLLDFARWTPEFAITSAQADGLDLGPDHWAILDLLREHYAKHEIAPPMRLLVKLIARHLGEERGNSRFLYRLFPEGPAKQACRYAGLPKPVSCI